MIVPDRGSHLKSAVAMPVLGGCTSPSPKAAAAPVRGVVQDVVQLVHTLREPEGSQE